MGYGEVEEHVAQRVERRIRNYVGKYVWNGRRNATGNGDRPLLNRFPKLEGTLKMRCIRNSTQNTHPERYVRAASYHE